MLRVPPTIDFRYMLVHIFGGFFEGLTSNIEQAIDAGLACQ